MLTKSLLENVCFVTGTEAKEGQGVGDVKRDRDRGSVGFWEEARCLKGEAFPKERKALDHPVTLWQTPALPSIHSVKLNYLPQGDTY